MCHVCYINSDQRFCYVAKWKSSSFLIKTVKTMENDENMNRML